jgi:protein Mpv17
MSPFYILAFFTGITLMDGHDLEIAREKIKSEFFPTFIVDMSVWPAAQFMNFKYVPIKHQVMVVNSIGIFYNTFISYMQRIA